MGRGRRQRGRRQRGGDKGWGVVGRGWLITTGGDDEIKLKQVNDPPSMSDLILKVCTVSHVPFVGPSSSYAFLFN